MSLDPVPVPEPSEIDVIGRNIAQAVAASTVIEGSFIPTREQMRAMQREMISTVDAAAQPHTTVEVEHMFADGQYARKYPMPAGQWAITKTHRKKHFIVCCGDATIWTETAMKRLVGLHCFITHPGTKRVIYAHADTVFMTFHATALTDPAAIEDELIEAEDPYAVFEDIQPGEGA